MQIKKIALAALVAVAAVPAFATIATGSDNDTGFGGAELVFTAYNEKGSFTKDLGISANDFITQMNTTGSFNMSVLGSEYSKFQALGGSAAVWSIQAANPIDFGFSPGEINYFGTKGQTQIANNITNILFNNGVQNLSGFYLQIDVSANNAGIGADAGINNVELTGSVGTDEYALGYANLGNAYDNTNAIGVASEMYYITSTSANSGAKVFAKSMADAALRVNFDGATITAISPVPEPSTYAMLMAGLLAVGFVARRRQA